MTKLKASPRCSWLRVRENKKENISVFFNLFLFCFISNSKSKFENSHCFLLIIFFKVIFAEFSKPNIFLILGTCTGFIRGILRGVRYAKSLRVLFLHRRSPSWTTLVLYSRVVLIFNEPTTVEASPYGDPYYRTVTVDPFRRVFGSSSIFFGNLMFCFSLKNYVSNIYWQRVSSVWWNLLKFFF